MENWPLPQWLISLLRFAAKLLFCLFITYVVWRIFGRIDPHAGAIAFVVVAPLWAALYARDIINFLPFIKHSAEASVTKKWQGRYFSFNGHHLRFYFVEKVIWLPEADLRPLIVPPLSERELRWLGDDYGIIPETGETAVSETGLLRLLQTRTAHRRADFQMVRFKRWLETETLPNLKRRPSAAANDV